MDDRLRLGFRVRGLGFGRSCDAFGAHPEMVVVAFGAPLHYNSTFPSGACWYGVSSGAFATSERIFGRNSHHGPLRLIALQSGTAEIAGGPNKKYNHISSTN